MAADPFGLAAAAAPFNQLAAALQLQLQAHAIQQQQEHQQLHQLALQQQAMLDGAAAIQVAQMQQQQQQQAQLLAQLQLQQQVDAQQLQQQVDMQQLQQHVDVQQQQQQQQPVLPPAPQQFVEPTPQEEQLPPTPTPAALAEKAAAVAAAMKPGDKLPLPRLKQHQNRPRPRASKEEYIGVACHICSAPADGMHYSAISCRSCNAFFRRAVSYEHQYACRFGGNCEITVQLRCACRACRYRKCVEAGMRDKAVQPPRDPTGSQKEKRKAAADAKAEAEAEAAAAADAKAEAEAEAAAAAGAAKIPAAFSYPPGKTEREIIREQQIRDGAGTSSGIAAGPMRFSDEEMEGLDDLLADDHMSSTVSDPQPLAQMKPKRRSRGGPTSSSSTSRGGRKTVVRKRTAPQLPPLEEDAAAPMEDPSVKMEIDDPIIDNATPPLDDNARILGVIEKVGKKILHGMSRDKYVDRPWEVETEEHGYERFKKLIVCYREHTRMMQLGMTGIDAFLGQSETGIELREMVPADVNQLSTTELNGLLYWIEKLEPFSSLPPEDRRALFKRYSVRKLSLDHFYTASRWTEACKEGNFVMLNNTYVPPHKTGFELETDDDRQIKAKAEILLPTFEQMWRCVIWPFAKMKITDAEMVFLHTLLLWSPLNNMHVTKETKDRMAQLREEAIKMMFDHYTAIDQDEAPVRFGEIVHLLAEIEVICDRHCQDFQVAKLFEFCDMSQFWYEKWCYSAPIRPDYSKLLCMDLTEMMQILDTTGEQPGPLLRDEVNTMQVPAAACHSPLYNEQGETMEQMYDRELAERMAAKEARKREEEAMALKAEEDGDEYVVPEKRANIGRTPSAPSTTPSTPRQRSPRGH
uniref:Nuclear receptor n=1 Tax=Pristionchus pacificus TaxID=54126 RepID=A0A8R1UCX6_PRIPA